ncbi:MAG TPA: RNA polymerase sigma factor [Nannocystis sp.]
MATDAELLTRWRAGDSAAGSALVDRHLPTLARFFRGKTADVADVVQQTLVACVKASERIPEGLEFRAWLLGIARNVLLHDLRRRGRKPAPDELDEQALAAPSRLSPSRVIAARDERRLLLAALRRLPLDLQWIIELHYWEGMRQDAIAAVLAVPPGTIKSRLSRARQLLRAQVEQLAADPALRASTLDDLDRWAREVADRHDDDP